MKREVWHGTWEVWYGPEVHEFQTYGAALKCYTDARPGPACDCAVLLDPSAAVVAWRTL